jgi:hypothetical protein
MTAQEIFDLAATRLLAQGAPAFNTDPHLQTCSYLTDDGLMCAVGILFNDEEMDAYGDFVGQFVDILQNDIDEGILRPFFHEHKELLSKLQAAHDKGAYYINDLRQAVGNTPEVWRQSFIDEMKLIAFEMNLDPGVLA